MAWVTDERLNEIIQTHASSLEAYIASARSDLTQDSANSLELSEVVAEKESLLKRNIELAALLSHSQKTVAEQEVGRGTRTSCPPEFRPPPHHHPKLVNIPPCYMFLPVTC